MEKVKKQKRPTPPFLSAVGRWLKRAAAAVNRAFRVVWRFLKKLLNVRTTRSLGGDLANLLLLTLFAVVMIIPMV